MIREKLVEQALDIRKDIEVLEKGQKVVCYHNWLYVASLSEFFQNTINKLKEKYEKIIAEIEEIDRENKENECGIYFVCEARNGVCVVNNETGACKYLEDNGQCNSTVARVNKCVLELKKSGLSKENIINSIGDLK